MDGRTPGAPPDGSFEEELAAFAAELTKLRIAQGKPSLLEIERHAPAARPMSKSAISEALAGKRLPGLDFLIALVQTLYRLGDPQRRAVSGQDPRLELWRSRWRQLEVLRAGDRRTPSVPATVAGDPGTAAGPAGPTETRVLRCFVAMPGTSMGGSAGWTDIPAIRRRLLEPAAELIEKHLGCAVTLVIEKEKSATGPVHHSMFTEAMHADIYIADLTGANPNVYLELGVRWAVSDGVTILICQDIAGVRFNAAANRIIEYGPMPDALEDAVHRIARAAVDGIRAPTRIDSPVRQGSPMILVPRARYEDLVDQLDRLRAQQAEELLEAAHRTADLPRKIALLEEAVSRNPAGWQAHVELGTLFRREGRYAEAGQALRRAVELKPDFAPAWRELGIALGKSGAADAEAIDAFDRALTLDDSDAETWATQGGLLRKLSRGNAAGPFDQALLERALACYRKADRLTPNQLYPLMNLARLELLLAGLRGEDTRPAQARIRDLEHLARYTVSSGRPGDPWALFDLADALLLTGRVPAGLAELRRAMTLVAPEERASVLATVAEPLRDFLSIAPALPSETTQGIREALELCRTGTRA